LCLAADILVPQDRRLMKTELEGKDANMAATTEQNNSISTSLASQKRSWTDR